MEKEKLIYTDLHVHSKYSRATSMRMEPEIIADYAEVKGLDIVGTGDFTHPIWLKTLEDKLVKDEYHEGLFQLKNGRWRVKFILQTEVSTVFEYEGKVRKVHHVILSPSIEVVNQINDELRPFGDLEIDGRPTLNVSAPELVEILKSISREVEVFPSHAWTPWYGVFGSKSGFNSLDECYQDEIGEIHALETGLSCYDEKTEVLTDNGWKRFSEVRYSDKICTLNLKTNKIEFQRPLRILSYRYRGKMYRLKTRRVDLLVTPNHRLLVSGCNFRKPPRFFLKEAIFLFNKSKRVKKNGIWVGKNHRYFILPSVKIRYGNRRYPGVRRKPKKRLPMRDWLKFFGFWLAEGWTGEGKNGDYDVYLASKNLNLLSEMKRILESFGYTVHQVGDVVRVRDFQLYSYLKQFGRSQDKFIPREIKSLSKELLEILLEYYLKGDGHVYGRTKKGMSATTVSTRLRDDLQEIALKVGMSAYYKKGRRKGTPIKSSHPSFKEYRYKHDPWKVFFTRKNIHTILPSMIKKYNHTESWVDFDGVVYCVSVPNKVIYVRRNGIPVWCGNSDPPMNWRLSSLDKLTLISASDSHSPYPIRIGREATVFNLEEISYTSIIEAIRSKDSKRLPFTVEVPPQYGKYHYSGHRKCGVVMSPKEAIRRKNICPVCGRQLTVGVEQRVEELADRPPLERAPEGFPGYIYLLPLEELIERTLPRTRTTEIYKKLVGKGGSEYDVLINMELREIASLSDSRLASAIGSLREGKLTFKPGFDGVYGEVIFRELEETSKKKSKTKLDYFISNS